MSDKEKCIFCGSKSIVLETPYIEMTSWKGYKHKTTYCCNAQTKNQKYIEARFTNREDKPHHSDVSKW